MSSDYQGLNVFCTPYDVRNKEKSINDLIRTMLNRTQAMFTYTGLPDTMPQREIEMLLQLRGFGFVTEVNGNLYIFSGGLGGVPNEYYLPSEIVLANPKLSPYMKKEPYKIDVDGVLVWGDSLMVGLLPICQRYATLLTENNITLRTALINLRSAFVISAADDITQKSAEEFIRNIEDGKQASIAEGAFFDGVKIQPALGGISSNYITQIIEAQQYLKASWFNELGLNANYNMKRESIMAGESAMNLDSLLPLADNMLECRKIGVEKINAMYGTNITVDFNSAWENVQQACENVGEITDTENETAEQEDEPTDENTDNNV